MWRLLWRGASVPLQAVARATRHFAWAPAMSSSAGPNVLVSSNYEVFGRVQGVFFRKHTEKEAKRLGLRGWVKNTPRGTVQGQLQGSEENVRIMKAWLRNTGSPSSKIEKVQFSDERRIPQLEHSDFRIVK